MTPKTKKMPAVSVWSLICRPSQLTRYPTPYSRIHFALVDHTFCVTPRRHHLYIVQNYVCYARLWEMVSKFWSAWLTEVVAAATKRQVMAQVLCSAFPTTSSAVTWDKTTESHSHLPVRYVLLCMHCLPFCVSSWNDQPNHHRSASHWTSSNFLNPRPSPSTHTPSRPTSIAHRHHHRTSFPQPLNICFTTSTARILSTP